MSILPTYIYHPSLEFDQTVLFSFDFQVARISVILMQNRNNLSLYDLSLKCRCYNNFERRPWLRHEYLTPQPCTAMAHQKEPWGKAVRSTRHHIGVGKRAAGIHQVTWTRSVSILYENWRLLIRKLLQKAAPSKGVAFSHIGLTLRPHSTMQTEVLNMGFVPACKFDHSMSSYSLLSYIMSASSLTDMPVAPHPVGSSLLGTLAPSSSSSNDQPTKFHSLSINLKTTTTGGSETVAMKSFGLLL
ncbi:hypothetical protein DY000_02026135 [Brassica cretica]|uniref:Uncharacterized protein n=1 Tax=Brassica cretica TaxID=69181 RepID=A0ABQ7EK26_BRACR|nr:hypothetical protein DY000_02026135 [Brassica cretica]